MKYHWRFLEGLKGSDRGAETQLSAQLSSVKFQTIPWLFLVKKRVISQTAEISINFQQNQTLLRFG